MNRLKPYTESHWIESNEIIFLLVARETESLTDRLFPFGVLPFISKKSGKKFSPRITIIKFLENGMKPRRKRCALSTQLFASSLDIETMLDPLNY